MKNKIFFLLIVFMGIAICSKADNYIVIYKVDGDNIQAIDTIYTKDLQRFDLTDNNVLYIDSNGVYFEYNFLNHQLVNNGIIKDEYTRKKMRFKIVEEICYNYNEDNDFYIAYETGYLYQFFKKKNQASLMQIINDDYYQIMINNKRDLYFYSARFKYNFGGRLSMNNIQFLYKNKSKAYCNHITIDEENQLSEFNTYQVLNFDISPNDDKYIMRLHNNHILIRDNINTWRNELDYIDNPLTQCRFLDNDTVLISTQDGSISAGHAKSGKVDFFKPIIQLHDTIYSLNVLKPNKKIITVSGSKISLFQYKNYFQPAILQDVEAIQDEIIYVKQSFSERFIGVYYLKK